MTDFDAKLANFRNYRPLSKEAVLGHLADFGLEEVRFAVLRFCFCCSCLRFAPSTSCRVSPPNGAASWALQALRALRCRHDNAGPSAKPTHLPNADPRIKPLTCPICAPCSSWLQDISAHNAIRGLSGGQKVKLVLAGVRCSLISNKFLCCWAAVLLFCCWAARPHGRTCQRKQAGAGLEFLSPTFAGAG